MDLRWSAEDEAYVGTVAELPSLSWVATDRAEAFEGIEQLVAGVVEDMLADGEQPPEAIADRTYSGKFQVRIPPEAHRQASAGTVSLRRDPASASADERASLTHALPRVVSASFRPECRSR